MNMIPFGKTCKLQNGRAFKPSEWSESGTPIVRIQNLNNESKPFNYCNFEVEDRFHINSGDLLFSWSGTPGTSFGAFFWNKGKGFLNQHIFRVDVDEKKFDKNYLCYAINSKLIEIIDQAHGGVGLKHITKGKLEAICLPLFSLIEQKRIAAILDKADTIRRKRQQAIDLADQLLRSVFLNMFGDTSRFNIVEIKNIATKKKYSLSSGPFGSNLSSKHYESDGVIVLRGMNVSAGQLNLDNVKYISELKAKELERSEISPDDIVIVAVGSSGHALKIPKTLKKAVMSQNFNKVSPDKTKATPTYLEYCFNSQLVQEQFRRNITDTVRTFLSLTKIKEVKIPLPPLDLQIQFEKIIKQIHIRKKRLVYAEQESEKLCESLTQQAFKGKLSGLTKAV